MLLVGGGHVELGFTSSMAYMHNTAPYASSISPLNIVLPHSPNRMFLLGMGFVGKFLGEQLKSQGWNVSGSCTSFEKKKKLEELGFDVFHFDANEPEWRILDALKFHTHLLVSVPPLIGIGDPMLSHEELLVNKLMDGNLQWLGYLSSTSVYGNCGNQLVNEDYPANPTSELAKLRLDAEKRWLKMGHKLRVSSHVFRLGGIYGPGRSAVDTLIKQEALSDGKRKRAAKLYTSRVHVEDICQAIEASFNASVSGRVYNVVDDDPAPREQVFDYARKLIEKKWRGQIRWHTELEDASVAAKKEASSAGKRVSNARMKDGLGVTLLYPSYLTGLQSIVDQMRNTFEHPPCS